MGLKAMLEGSERFSNVGIVSIMADIILSYQLKANPQPQKLVYYLLFNQGKHFVSMNNFSLLSHSLTPFHTLFLHTFFLQMMGLLSVQYVIVAAALLSFFMSPTIGQLMAGNMSTVMPKICLNMIVKNEAKVIKRLLDSVLPLIDSYCICDTGSTDGTADLIDAYMRDHGVPGKLLHEPFRDFGHTRSFALHAAIDQMDADYLLLLDADMVLQYPGGIDSDALVTLKHRLVDYDVWYVFQGTPQFYNKNVRLIRNRPGFSYWGVTHEYVQTVRGSTIGTFEPVSLSYP